MAIYGRVLLMLEKVQLELQKLVDSYEMKRRCDEKSEVFEGLVKRSKDKGRIKSSKGEGLSPHQLEVAQDEYDEEANTFFFRMKSLKQGQSCSLLMQAARHHSAQILL
ncbi:OLC1v1001799C1 [Oldenlandia corymbosa var. corymbosa]|uniref:OLC1v1001799C1 n=1 Tax=Oldenlandia corymbosa var. corymbosa TaxID=529605 RepID=A0AAV1D7B1_OLDCO|nr:OLC1v1001799C1 [Oldenlandia corymbosa var. corymbosa]